MEINMIELLTFTLRLMHTFLFEAYAGTKLYQYFCTASIYIFSRTTNRAKWYYHEMFKITFQSFLFQFVSMFSTILITTIRYSVNFDSLGIKLFLYHILIFSFWICAMTILVNMFAVLAGSSASFVLSFGIQVALISALLPITYIKENKTMADLLKSINPVSHLILGWHRIEIQNTNEFLYTLSNSLSFHRSLLLVVAIYIGVVVLGLVLIMHIDLIISNTETEVL